MPPPEEKVLTGVEVLCGFIYLVHFLALPSFLYLLLSALSFIIAFGIWRLYKWAWFLCLSVSIIGIVLGISAILALGVESLSMTSKVIIDLIVILMLVSKDVRNDFKLGF